MKVLKKRKLVLLLTIVIFLSVISVIIYAKRVWSFEDFFDVGDNRYLLDSIPLRDGMAVYWFERGQLLGEAVSFVTVDSSVCMINEENAIVQGFIDAVLVDEDETIIIVSHLAGVTELQRNNVSIPYRIEQYDPSKSHKRISIQEGVYLRDICSKP